MKKYFIRTVKEVKGTAADPYLAEFKKRFKAAGYSERDIVKNGFSWFRNKMHELMADVEVIYM